MECRGTSSVVFDASLTGYDFGPGHPMSPARVDLTMRLADELGVLADLVVLPAPHATAEQLLRVHTPEYLAAVERAGGPEAFVDLERGLGTEDNPIFPRMHEASAHVAGATVEACRQVWSGESLHSANIAGGLHHAMPGRASGFCVYNDIAVGIADLLASGAQRIAYIDLDVHHGDGVEAIFRDDPRVLTISLHESGDVLFPGTGFAGDIGGPGAEGTSVNVALPPGTSDAGWLRAFHAVVPPLLAEFGPDVIVSQHGCDSHMEDPLAHLMLSVDGQRAAHMAVHQLAHDWANGRWVALGGGGYAVVEVVPRAWTHLLAVLAGAPLDPSLDTPQAWREHVQIALGRMAPWRMTDGRNPLYRPWVQGYDPDAALDRAVNATRESVFPWHGIDPSP